MMKRYIWMVLAVLTQGLAMSASAQRVSCDSMMLRFRQSHIEIDRNYDRNGQRLDSLLLKFTGDSLHYAERALRHVEVSGGASPEGSVSFNEYLSQKRADAIFGLFRQRGLVTDSMTSFTFRGRDWNGLLQGVRRDAAVPYRDEVIELLENIVSGSPAVQHPLQMLKSMRGGEPYRYMYRNLFPALRESKIRFCYTELYPSISFPNPMQPLTMTGIPAIPAPVEIATYRLGRVKECRPFYMALKTNMLYDALALPNIGAEFYVGKGWSVTGDWMYGWWDNDHRHRYWRAYGGWVGVRRWFGRRSAEKPLTGHHIGLFAGAVTYDFEFGGPGIMGGLPHRTLWDRCNVISGIEYGYSLPVARRLNIDFSVAVGYIGGKYLKYTPQGDFYVWQSTHRLNWIGPTKAEISLVWLIGCDNYNR